jgi:kynurenine formamidase
MMSRFIFRVSTLLTAPCFVLGVGCAADQQYRQSAWQQSRLVDLTHSFASDTIVWPTEQDFKLVVQHAEHTELGYYYSSNLIEMPEHGGTHIDAPIHFSEGKQTLDQIPMEHLIGAGVRIDVTESCGRDQDYRVALSDIKRWEAKHGQIPYGAIVLLNTGYARFWRVGRTIWARN